MPMVKDDALLHGSCTQHTLFIPTMSRVSITASLRFQILTAESVKMTASWDVAPCSLTKVDWRFRGTYYLHHQDDDGGNTHIWNVGLLQRDYSISQKVIIFILAALRAWNLASNKRYSEIKWRKMKRMKHMALIGNENRKSEDISWELGLDSRII
jgi:hypothetical protein